MCTVSSMARDASSSREGQTPDSVHLSYFVEQIDSNREFWQRFGRRPRVDGLRVLDLGCGHGAMTLDLARAGASVVGVELDGERAAFAERHLLRTAPELAERVS